MSGEADVRPNLPDQIRELRDRLFELERRVAGDQQAYDLSDLNDVRVDSLGDATITLADGNALVYRAADKLWVPGGAGAPGSLSRAFLTSAGSSGNPSGSGASLIPDGASIIVGSDISEGTGTDIGRVNTDGVYSVGMALRTDADAAADTFAWALFLWGMTSTLTTVPGSINDSRVPPLNTATNKHYASSFTSWTGFLHATDTIGASATLFGGGGGTWTLSGGVYVQRLS